MEQPAMKVGNLTATTLMVTFEQLRILNDALNHMGNKPYWEPEFRKRFDDLHRMIRVQIEHIEKPAKEEEILQKAAAILRGRGIKEWTP